MTQLGYALSSEEHPPSQLVSFAARAEEAGFDFAMISDHFHPWVDHQGHSAFVWSVIGGIAQVTDRLVLGTGVTCPIVRIHPALVAQAAATAAAMMPGRFMLGVGTGENLNEHVLGDRWPAPAERFEMLEEAIEIIRKLWEGESTSHRGRHFTVDRARIYTLPEQLPPILVAARGKKAVELAGRNDGLISTAPDAELVKQFKESEGNGKPRFGMLHVCWAETEQDAKATAHQWWPNVAAPGQLNVELPLPKHFEQVAESITAEDVAREITCGPDPAAHIEAITTYVDAGYDHVYVHQIGPDQEGFFRFYAEDIIPKFS